MTDNVYQKHIKRLPTSKVTPFLVAVAPSSLLPKEEEGAKSVRHERADEIDVSRVNLGKMKDWAPCNRLTDSIDLRDFAMCKEEAV